MAQWVKDMALSLLWLGVSLWHWFDPWSHAIPWLKVKKNQHENSKHTDL